MSNSELLSRLGKERLYFDGATGTELAKLGLLPGEAPEVMSLRAPEAVEALHRAYFDAGADIIKTNTFGANRLKYENYDEIIRASVGCALRARGDRDGKYVALDIGPTGRMIEPLGDLPFETAVEIFSEMILAADGMDLILIETMNDTLEMKAALLAAKENSSLPVFVTCVYDASGKMLTGASPEVAVEILQGLGADAIGLNCSLGPDLMCDLVSRFVESSSIPLVVNPNAGLPEVIGDKTVFSFDESEFASYMVKMAPYSAVMGGCCGTSPEYIKALAQATRDIPLQPITKKYHTRVTSFAKYAEIGPRTLIVGERLNPTGKKKLKEALRSGDMSYVLLEATAEAEAGAHVLDVNVGLPDIDEKTKMCEVIKTVQSVCDLPLQIDSADPKVLETAMRIYNGKPLVNSVNGSESSMSAVLPLVKKYGGAVIALTLDENGIPSDVGGRVEIARRIIARAADYGIDKKDVIVDPLALAVSADPKGALVTLGAVRALAEEGIYTSLGVSNISFGLPRRDVINSAFFSAALATGLNVAIINPLAEGMMNAYRAHEALFNMDPECGDYIAYATSLPEEKSNQGVTRVEKNADVTPINTLREAICRGLSKKAGEIASSLISEADAMLVIENEIIPALDEVGKRFERGETFLPSLLSSAEAATVAFGEVRKAITTGKGESTGEIVLATVLGDMHDIGKNIVRVILESHGFTVHDLGRNVSPEAVLAAVERTGARLVGLSALMTTTVPAMERTVKLIAKEHPDVKVMVGGAVMTREYAKMIGADYYAADAMGAARVCKSFFDKM